MAGEWGLLQKPHCPLHSICNPFPTTFCRFVSQFPVASDPKLVASDHTASLPTTKLPTKMNVVVTDDECGEHPTTNFWSALMCQSTVAKAYSTTSSTFSSIQKIAVAKHAAFKRHVPPQSVHKIHNIYKPKPPSPPSPPTPPTTLVIARPPIKAVIASSPHRGVSPSLRRIPAYIVTSHTGLHRYVLIAYRYTHRCCVAYRTSRCVAYRY